MRLDPIVRDYPQFMDELTKVLESPLSRFYMDTSILMWLVRLSPEARSEFVGWCRNLPDGCVRVPVWAAHELHSHLTRDSIGKDILSTVSSMQQQLDDFARLASERASEQDSRNNGYTSRQGFVAEVEHTIAKVKQLLQVVGNNSKLNAAADEVVELVNDHALETNISQIIHNLEETGDIRYSHRIPPGYKDKGKSENRFGDVIIWEEILEDIRVEKFTKRRDCVLISRDDKTDWVSSARRVNVDSTSMKSNRDVGLDVARPHPLLAHEFEGRARGGKLYIVHPSFLASALDYASRKAGTTSAVSNWVAAAHRSDLLPELATEKLPIPDRQVAAPANLGETWPTQAPVTPPWADLAYRYPSAAKLMALRVTDEVHSYEQTMPVDVPALVQTWYNQVISGEFAPERFGRLLAELSLRGLDDWLTRVRSVLEELGSELSSHTLNGVVLGATAPAYFDQYGEALRQPRKELGAVALQLELDTMLADAFATLAGFLADADVKLPYIPGTGRNKIEIAVDTLDGGSGIETLRDIRVGSESVLAHALPGDSPRLLSTLINREEPQVCSGQELCGLLSREYLLPLDLLGSELHKKRFSWASDAGLVSVDTSSPGGLSATVLDEGDDLE